MELHIFEEKQTGGEKMVILAGIPQNLGRVGRFGRVVSLLQLENPLTETHRGVLQTLPSPPTLPNQSSFSSIISIEKTQSESWRVTQ